MRLTSIASASVCTAISIAFCSTVLKAARDSINLPRVKAFKPSASSASLTSAKVNGTAGNASRTSATSGLRLTLNCKGGNEGLAGTCT